MWHDVWKYIQLRISTQKPVFATFEFYSNTESEGAGGHFLWRWPVSFLYVSNFLLQRSQLYSYCPGKCLLSMWPKDPILLAEIFPQILHLNSPFRVVPESCKENWSKPVNIFGLSKACLPSAFPWLSISLSYSIPKTLNQLKDVLKEHFNCIAEQEIWPCTRGSTRLRISEYFGFQWQTFGTWTLGWLNGLVEKSSF